MSNDKPDNKSPLVPVKTVTFIRDLSIPGKGMCGSVTTTPDENPRGETAKRWRVDFDLRIRHHRIQCWENGVAKDAPPTSTIYVSAEAAATWEQA